MESLNIKYRPKNFDDCVGQNSLIKILKRQLELHSYKNCYLFSGPSGCGKTTIARIFASEINKGLGSPIEVDGASNNGVDNVRELVENANERSLDSEYKIIIIDECHMITTAGWNAFLKCIEEPPKYTIFIFCTTEFNKVPLTIQNRCQIFNLSRVEDSLIKNRLVYICNNECYNYNEEAIDYIVKMSNGSVRQAISYLDKCKDLSTNISIDNVISCLGDCSYDSFFNLTNYIIDNNKEGILNLIEKLYIDGTDLKLFINNYFTFVLQLTKYCIFNRTDGVNIPLRYEDKIKYTTGIENNVQWFNKLLDNILELKQFLKNDFDIKTTVEVLLLRCSSYD